MERGNGFMQPNIVGVRFSKVGKVYHFDSTSIPDLAVGESVIVDTVRGRQIGEITQRIENPPPPSEGTWKLIERKATPADLLLRQTWVQKQTEAMINCRARAAELNLAGIKIIAAEYSFEGARLALMFSTETEDKVDLKSLRKDMQKLYPHSQVEMRQIGPRDVAKLLGGMGACGLETRCCSKFLTEFSPISIKMAKEQGISLTPTEITGMCGRLRCCLIYEYEQYVAARKELPKRGKRVVTPDGEGKVLDTFPLRNVVLVELDPKVIERPEKSDHSDRPERFERPERPIVREFSREDLEPWDELEALRRKSEAACDKHGTGECDCGKKEKNLKAKK